MWQRVGSFLVILAFLSSCNGQVQYEKYFEIPDSKWDHDQVINFELEIEDATQAYDLYINVRHTNDYPYSNLWTMLYYTPANGQGTQQRMEFKLAQPDGKWLGNGFGSTVTHEIKVRSGIKFEQPGKVVFTLQHDMRINPVPAVSHMGLRLEKAAP